MRIKIRCRVRRSSSHLPIWVFPAAHRLVVPALSFPSDREPSLSHRRLASFCVSIGQRPCVVQHVHSDAEVRILPPQPASRCFHSMCYFDAKCPRTRRMWCAWRCLRIAKPKTRPRISAAVSAGQFRYLVSQAWFTSHTGKNSVEPGRFDDRKIGFRIRHVWAPLAPKWPD
jgi:hypothetical protein